MRVKYRDGCVGDVQVLTELDSICFDAKMRYSSTFIKSLLEKRHTFCVVAENGEDPVGFILAETLPLPETVGHLVTIDVHPDCRKRGIGAELLEKSHEWVVKRKLEKVLLEVYTCNRTAIRFYREHGYRVIANLDDYYGNGKDGYLMLKTLQRNSR